MRKFKLGILLAVILLFGFAKSHPKDPDNICHIFQQNPSWYVKAKKAQKRWGVPVAVQMAIMYQESGFDAEARARTSTAYGFSQVLNDTWRGYQKSVAKSARRNEFAAAADFIGWYCNMMKHQLGISVKNTYAVYLAYHEGLGGYRSKSYTRKPKVMMVARKVMRKAQVYQNQLLVCREKIEKSTAS